VERCLACEADRSEMLKRTCKLMGDVPGLMHISIIAPLALMWLPIGLASEAALHGRWLRFGQRRVGECRSLLLEGDGLE